MITNKDQVDAKDALINKDPFCPVRLQRHIGYRGEPTDKFMVELQSEDGNFVEIAGVDSVHGPRYVLVPNQRVHDMALAVMDKTGMAFKPLPSFRGGHSKSLVWNGKSYTERWYAPEVLVKSPQGTDVMLGMEVCNSYVGNCGVKLSFFGMHVVCANQFHSKNIFGMPFDFTHVGDAGQLDGDFDSAFARLEQSAKNFGQVAPVLQALMSKRVGSFSEFRRLRRQMRDELGLVVRERELMDELDGCGVTAKFGVVTCADPYGEDTDTYWALLNAITAITTHLVGGATGRSQSERAVDFLIKEARQH